MESLKEAPIKRDWKFVVPPFHEQGVKDVGDIPVKTGRTVEQCRKAHWLDNSKDILANEKLINDHHLHTRHQLLAFIFLNSKDIENIELNCEDTYTRTL